MTEKIDMTITVPLDEFVKVVKMIFAFGRLLEDIDTTPNVEGLVDICDRASVDYGDEKAMLEEVPLITEFAQAYFGIDGEVD